MFGMQSRIERACLIGLLAGSLTDHRRSSRRAGKGRTLAVCGVEAQRDASVVVRSDHLCFWAASGFGTMPPWPRRWGRRRKLPKLECRFIPQKPSCSIPASAGRLGWHSWTALFPRGKTARPSWAAIEQPAVIPQRREGEGGESNAHRDKLDAVRQPGHLA
ncbi:hypothetical protein L1887_53801 [Cichorium endivia]|nr:hypothetical protein L1887_53801 [Cichorium endivia]